MSPVPVAIGVTAQKVFLMAIGTWKWRTGSNRPKHGQPAVHSSHRQHHRFTAKGYL